MDAELVDIIKRQTGIDNKHKIQQSYNECDKDIGNTILMLLNIQIPKKVEKIASKFDEIREIFDEKDRIYTSRKT